ncbi:cell division protein FtsQ/DivIB [Microbulbifer yueqingensis]|uniref:cell division protein FtsQ/DivIB n=1 Tax=Microbulbifer yueqingensis TaxID=658219 RepID=UPI001FDF56A1|nr:FtsQ-type POTRA domain-containing protein [Microbulbifer yueqingensis]
MRKKGQRGARPRAAQEERSSRLVPALMVTLAIGLVTGLAYGAVWGWQQMPVPQLSRVDALEHVRVKAPFRAVTRQQVEEMLLPYLRNGFFSLDIRGMRETLLGNPWITSASVSRRWPRGVEIRIEEAAPLAAWGRDRLLVASGQLLPRPEHLKTGRLPELAGDEELVERIMAQYQALARLLTTRDMEVKRLSFDDLAGWHLELVSGIELHLGHDELLERVNRFLSLSRGVLAPHLERVVRVDTRYGNAVAVQWKDNEQESD